MKGTPLAARAAIPGTARSGAARLLRPDPYRVYRVVRYCRATRRVLAVEADRLTHAEASVRAQALRAEHRDAEALYGFTVQTPPPAAQAVILAPVLQPVSPLVSAATSPAVAVAA